MRLSWYLNMALRDSRRQRGQLLLVATSMILGVAALVAIQSFGDSVQRELNDEARNLLGADIAIESRAPITEETMAFLDSLGLEISLEINFGSMVRFSSGDGTRLVNVRAIDGGYPFYGEIATEPTGVTAAMKAKKQALAGDELLLQFAARPGDTLFVGSLRLPLAGRISSVSGQSGITGSVAPPVFIPYFLAEESGLLQKGSRINYRLYGKYPRGFDESLYAALIKPRLESPDIRTENVEERRKRTGRLFSDLTGYLNLTALLALLIGCLGVASATHVYIQGKVKSVAILRCIGASAKDAMNIYLIQVALVALLASLAGVVAGALLVNAIPLLINELLPFSVNSKLSINAVILAVLAGVGTTLLFAAPPLLRIRKISPLQAIRSSGSQQLPSGNVLLTILLTALLLLFAGWQLRSWWGAILFTAACLGSLGLLALVARTMMVLVQKYFPRKGSFVLRQALGNLYRPNNQTLVLVVSIGLGTALIATLLINRQLFLDKIAISASGEEQPNMVLFDIQTGQIEPLEARLDSFGMPLIGRVPIVNMRLAAIGNRKAHEILADSTSDIPRRVISREYRVTYRDSLIDSEKLVKGTWTGRIESGQVPVPISLEERLAREMTVDVGDLLTFNVQGAEMPCVVGSIRKVDFQRVQTNFVLLFPAGVLERAPQFHVALTRFESTEQSARFQQYMVTSFPNISIIDLNLVLDTLDTITTKAGYIIQFMAIIGLLTALVVLIGAVRAGKYQRIKDGVLLRTIGASRKQILLIQFWEYFILGSLAAFTGLLIATVVSVLLASYPFDEWLFPQWTPLLYLWLTIVLVTTLIGMSNSLRVVKHPPLEILRSDALS
ncbi:MAG: FtsX-like permease family protein [Cryomorphaceae bacterium]|nr:MAG: FtsX-like permease family protein [Cryomorphaceae bacterium]